MKCSVPVQLVILMATINLSRTMPQDPTTSSTARSSPPIGETIKQLTKQLMGNDSSSSPSDVVFDVRTPPKIKQQLKKKHQHDDLENSHAGIAIPVDEESLMLEEASTKKLNFYKIEKPTTANSGLSTWILLSGQTTNKPKGNDTKMVVVTETPHRIVKPIFKKRPTTKLLTTVTEPTTKLTKVKATLLNGGFKNDTNTTLKRGSTTTSTTSSFGTKLSTKATTLSKSSTVTNKSTTPSKSPSKSTTSFKLTTKVMSTVKSSTTTPSTVDLKLEAKDGGMELSTNSTTTKKNRRNNNKRKKNKNKRKRPSADKNDTKTANKVPNKEKPISTQIYNYLSREVMPTVGVGLVGLMVTAGLASYFLYPFGAARRSYEIIDRKDKDNYYYHDHYSYGGVAEEELIGKVIAGMPQSTTYKPYRQHTTKSPYSYTKHRYVEQKYSTPDLSNHKMNPQGTVETVQLTPSVSYKSDDYSPQKNYQVDYYNDDNKALIEQNKQFVVGSYVKEPTPEVTPVTVPEHGPRGFNYRKRRQIDDKENEIDYYNSTSTSDVTTTISTTPLTSTTTKTNNTDVTNEKVNSIITLMRDLFILKLNLGLQVLQNATRSVSGFLSSVQRRLDEHYKNQTHH